MKTWSEVVRFKSDPIAAFSFRAQHSERKNSKGVSPDLNLTPLAAFLRFFCRAQLRSTQVDPLGSSEDSQYFNQDYKGVRFESDWARRPDTVDKNRDRRPRFLSLLRPEGHVFFTDHGLVTFSRLDYVEAPSRPKCVHIDELEQERRNSTTETLELRLSCTNPLIFWSYHRGAGMTKWLVKFKSMQTLAYRGSTTAVVCA